MTNHREVSYVQQHTVKSIHLLVLPTLCGL